MTSNQQNPRYPQSSQPALPQASPYPARPPVPGAVTQPPYGGQFPNHPQSGQPVFPQSQPYPPQALTPRTQASPAVEPAPSASMSTNVYVNAPVSGQRNGIGTAGFVLALLGIFLAWIPVAGFIIWILGAIFSLIGIFRRPRELAIAGAAISFSGIFILLLAIVGFASYL